MRRKIKQLLTGAAVAGLALTALSAPVEAGEASSQSSFFTNVYGPDAQTVLDGLSLEIFEGSPDPGPLGADITATASCTSDSKIPRFGIGSANRYERCQLGDDDDTYTLGVDGVPDGWNVAGSCYTSNVNYEAIPGYGTTFTLGQGEHVSCQIFVAPDDASMVFSVVAGGLGHEEALAGVAVEVYQGGTLLDPLDCTATDPAAIHPAIGPPGTGFAGSCDLPVTGPGNRLVEEVAIPDNYELGISELPEGYSVDFAYCSQLFLDDERFDDPSVSFEVYDDEFGLPSAQCEIYIDGPPTVYIEHVVNGGDAETTDFTTQLFDDVGALVGESSDPDPAFCSGGLIEGRLIEAEPMTVSDVCGAVVVPRAEHSVGAVLPDYGYEASAECVANEPFGNIENAPLERVVSDLTTFDADIEGDQLLCVLTADYYEQTISVDVVTDNSAGGESDGSDIEVEVYDQDGVKVDSGFDPLPNDLAQSAEFTLPIGDYTIGASGPDGYLFSVDITVVDNDITTTTVVPKEIIDDGSADLSLTSLQTASAELLATGQPAPTTTTTTTTTVAPTTTALGAGAGTLPATGGTSTTTALAWWALGLLAAGALIARLSRRPANSAS